MADSIDQVAQHSNSPVLVNGLVRNGSIETEISYAEIASLISEGQIVVLKNVFELEMIFDFRRAITRWGKETPQYLHGRSPNTTPALNYHRIDDGIIKSSLPHIFHQFGFNTLEALDDYVGRTARHIAELMRQLQNAVAETSFDFSLTGLRVKLIHYPAGGGFLAEHSHPLEPQRIGLITSLARIGEDFLAGGTTFHTPFGLVDTHQYHDIGDIIIFRYDLPHGVSAVDEEKDLDWNSEAGKWSFVLDMRRTHDQTHSM